MEIADSCFKMEEIGCPKYGRLSQKTKAKNHVYVSRHLFPSSHRWCGYTKSRLLPIVAGCLTPAIADNRQEIVTESAGQTTDVTNF